MNWTNFLTKKYADQYKYCPVVSSKSSSWSIEQTLQRVELDLREHYKNTYKNLGKDLFVKHIISKAYDEIDWSQLARYWADEAVTSNMEVQLELL